MTAGDFVGTWTLVSWRIRQGEDAPQYPLGPKATGLLVYAADGYMFAALSAPGRSRFQGDDPLGGTRAEAYVAMSGYHTYCGRYRLEDGAIVHRVEMSLFPNMVGTEQVRYYRFDGDTLILSTPPLTRNGLTGVAELVWRRANGMGNENG